MDPLSRVGECAIDRKTLEHVEDMLAALVTRGVTVIVSSGDNGARIPPSQILSCSPEKDVTYTEACGKTYAAYPASSKWVTSLGGTMFGRTNTGDDVEYERVCSTQHGSVITSGGGFSSVFNAPKWQAAAVNKWKNTRAYAMTKASLTFNDTGRAYPDVSLVAQDYVVVDNGKVISASGTSASAPAFAGLISLINEARKEAGLPVMGFLNPFLYSLGPGVLNDITEGANQCFADFQNESPVRSSLMCCGPDSPAADEGSNYVGGFSAERGWDPASGLGSLRSFDALLKEALIFGNVSHAPSSVVATTLAATRPHKTGSGSNQLYTTHPTLLSVAVAWGMIWTIATIIVMTIKIIQYGHSKFSTLTSHSSSQNGAATSTAHEFDEQTAGTFTSSHGSSPLLNIFHTSYDEVKQQVHGLFVTNSPLHHHLDAPSGAEEADHGDEENYVRVVAQPTRAPVQPHDSEVEMTITSSMDTGTDNERLLPSSEPSSLI